MDDPNGTRPSRTAEMVTNGHPDKFCDQVADSILDAALAGDPASRVAIECLAKDNLMIVSGEMTTDAAVNVEEIAKTVWEKTIGYGSGDHLSVLNNIKQQSDEIAQGAGTESDAGVLFGGAGDQGIMIGYATSENQEMLPQEYVLARRICRKLFDLRRSGELSWLGADGKSQVTLDAGRVTSVIVAAQHSVDISIEDVRSILNEKVVAPIVGPADRVVINGTGIFTIGGTQGDAGVVGRKIVADAYGPRVPVGGGAYSGKDPSKVDRSAAYMARHIAKHLVANRIGGATECQVAIAFGIGQTQPEMVTARTDTGKDVSDWVRENFKDLSPSFITERLDLRKPTGWTYCSTAAFGHYGREEFPWERID